MNKYQNVEIRRGSVNSGSNEKMSINTFESSPMKFKELERLRMKGELLSQKKADMARGRTLDGLLTSPEKQRSYLKMEMSNSPVMNTQDSQSNMEMRKWGGNKMYVDRNQS